MEQLPTSGRATTNKIKKRVLIFDCGWKYQNVWKSVYMLWEIGSVGSDEVKAVKLSGVRMYFWVCSEDGGMIY